MYNANDFIFDNRVRFAVERHTDLSLIPDWNKLEEKLDIEMPVKKKRGRFIVFWFLFAGVLAGTAYWGLDGNFNSKKNYANKSSLDIKQNAIVPNETVKNKNVTLQDETAVKNNTDNVLKDTEPNSNIIPEISNPQSIYSKKVSVNNSRKSSVSVTTPLMEQGNEVGGNAKVFGNKISNEKLSGSDIAVENKLNLDTEGINVPEKTTLANTDLIKEEDIAAIVKDTANNITNNPKPNAKKSNASRFSFTAVGGVNVNSVQLNKPSKPGYDYGLLVGYKISPKIEIRSGVILAKKYFTTSGKNISFDSAKLNLPSYNTISLENATGYCRFIEVPVMLYYQLSSKKKTNFYTAGGFSIIKMRMDNIHYRFLADGNTVLERSHTNLYHNGDGFSTSITANFSLGFKQMITDRWSFAIEPYIKLPLSRMNDSNLKFTTFGTLASLIYSLPARQKNNTVRQP